MSIVSREIATKRLSWVEDARQGILSAIGDDLIHPQFQVFPTVDPIKFVLKITLLAPLRKETREPLREYLRYWAEKHDCELPIIRITDRWVQAEVLTRHRHMERDLHGRFKKGGKRFVRRPR